MAFAPSSDASRGVLREKGFDGADTVARLLHDTKMQDKVNERTVLLIDEAGQLDVRSAGAIVSLAKERGARVILSGDTRQVGAVARGDALRLIEPHSTVKPAEIKEIRRQHGQYKDAVATIQNGQAAAGLEKLDAMGAIHEIASREERHERLVDDYMAHLRKGKDALVVAPTHREKDAIAGRIRDSLRAEGKLKGDDRAFTQYTSLKLTEAQRRETKSYEGRDDLVIQFHRQVKGKFHRGERVAVVGHRDDKLLVRTDTEQVKELDIAREAPKFDVYSQSDLRLAVGDTIRFTMNGRTTDKQHRLHNGNHYRVKGFTDRGDLVLNNGWTVDRDYAHLTQGYVTTIDASQGKDKSAVFIAMGAESAPAIDAKRWYVAVSQGRDAVHVYTTDREQLVAAVRRSGDRTSATELFADGNQEKEKPTRMQFMRRRLAEFTRGVAERARQAREAATRQLQQARNHQAPATPATSR